MAITFMVGFEAGERTTDGTNAPSGAVAYSTAQARTGTRSLRFNPASGASATLSGNAAGVVYSHFGLYVATLPSLDRVIAGNGTTSVSLKLTSAGALAVYSQTTLVGTSAATFATPGWHWVGYQITSTTGVVLQIDGADAVTGTVAPAASSVTIGCSLTEASSIDIYIDDWLADTASMLAPSKVIDLLPTADSAIGTGWTLGSGGTSNLWGGVDNQPPTAVADAGTTAQIRNAASAANSDYDATLQTYTVGGIGASDTVLAVRNVIATAAPVTTSAKLGNVGNASNPAIATIALGAGGTAGAFWSGVAGGTYPTGWKVSLGTLTASPSVTLGTGPVMRVTQLTASTRIAMVAYMALRVAWTPAAVAAERVPYATPYPSLIAQ